MANKSQKIFQGKNLFATQPLVTNQNVFVNYPQKNIFATQTIFKLQMNKNSSLSETIQKQNNLVFSQALENKNIKFAPLIISEKTESNKNQIAKMFYSKTNLGIVLKTKNNKIKKYFLNNCQSWKYKYDRIEAVNKIIKHLTEINECNKINSLFDINDEYVINRKELIVKNTIHYFQMMQLKQNQNKQCFQSIKQCLVQAQNILQPLNHLQKQLKTTAYYFSQSQISFLTNIVQQKPFYQYRCQESSYYDIFAKNIIDLTNNLEENNLEIVQLILHKKQGELDFNESKYQIWKKAFNLFKGGKFSNNLLWCHLQINELKEIWHCIKTKTMINCSLSPQHFQNQYFQQFQALFNPDCQYCDPKLSFEKEMYSSVWQEIWKYLKILQLHKKHRKQTLKQMQQYYRKKISTLQFFQRNKKQKLNCQKEKIKQEILIQCVSFNHLQILAKIFFQNKITCVQYCVLLTKLLKESFQQIYSKDQIQNILFQCILNKINQQSLQANYSYLVLFFMAFAIYLSKAHINQIFMSKQQFFEFFLKKSNSLQYMKNNLQMSSACIKQLLRKSLQKNKNYEFMLIFFGGSYVTRLQEQRQEKKTIMRTASIMKQAYSAKETKKNVNHQVEDLMQTMAIETALHCLTSPHSLHNLSLMEAAYSVVCKIEKSKFQITIQCSLARFLYEGVRIAHGVQHKDLKIIVDVYNYLVQRHQNIDLLPYLIKYDSIMNSMGLNCISLVFRFIDKIIISLKLIEEQKQTSLKNKSKIRIAIIQCKSIVKNIKRIKPDTIILADKLTQQLDKISHSDYFM